MYDLTNLSIEGLNALLLNAQQELTNRRKKCSHNKITYKHGSNTGNYDPSSDCYWVTIKCLDCGNVQTFYDEGVQIAMNNFGKLFKSTEDEYKCLIKFNKKGRDAHDIR